VDEVSVALPLHDITGAKMLKLQEVIDDQLEAEDRALAKVVAEYALTCFWIRDPQISLEPVVQGPIMKMEEATRADVKDAAKLVADLFEHQQKTHRAPASACSHRGFLSFVNKLVIASVERSLPQLISPSPK
jgi:hypothetical protein